jgi:hypothetical protein
MYIYIYIYIYLQTPDQPPQRTLCYLIWAAADYIDGCCLAGGVQCQAFWHWGCGPIHAVTGGYRFIRSQHAWTQFVNLFTGCRLCRRAPKFQESNINSWFFGLLDTRDHADLVWIEFSLKLPQELRQHIEYCLGNESQTFEKMDFNTFVKNYTFCGFEINRLGRNAHNGRGIISCFHQNRDFDM